LINLITINCIEKMHTYKTKIWYSYISVELLFLQLVKYVLKHVFFYNNVRHL
jgi:hypothetical protein